MIKKTFNGIGAVSKLENVMEDFIDGLEKLIQSRAKERVKSVFSNKMEPAFWWSNQNDANLGNSKLMLSLKKGNA